MTFRACMHLCVQELCTDVYVHAIQKPTSARTTLKLRRFEVVNHVNTHIVSENKLKYTNI
jgi:hypothetical protein